jgi:hypothetical protein
LCHTFVSLLLGLPHTPVVQSDSLPRIRINLKMLKWYEDFLVPYVLMIFRIFCRVCDMILDQKIVQLLL